MKTSLLKTVLVFILMHVGFAACASDAAHDLLLTLDPANGRLHGRDRIALPESVKGTIVLGLEPRLEVKEITANGVPLKFLREGDRLRVMLTANTKAVTVTYGGNPGATDPPVVTPEGTWLPGESNWFPRLGSNDTLKVTVITPAGQRTAMTGQLLSEYIGEDETRATFRAYPDGPPTVFAGPYVVQERMHRGLRLRTYFHREQAGLAAAYLDDVARHIDRFASIVGPYPYEGFAVVSATHPVGLGYPGLTYVSQEILHLPFMRSRSLPHEILHVWWGNAVQVADDSGNWAEGLTTYMADYGLADPADRERMRRTWLRDYAALPPADDTALSGFKGKLHARDQIVGYGKSATIFHMLAQHIGVPAFNDGLSRFYARYRGSAAGWADLQSAFEAASGRNLEGFFTQWLDRVGAPQLTLDRADFGDTAVQLTLSQVRQPYALEVPVVIDTADGRERHMVSLTDSRQTFSLRTKATPNSLRVDPENDLFRRLAPREMAPILRDLFLMPAAQTILVSVPEEAGAVARRLAQHLLQKAEEPVLPAGRSATRPALIVGIGRPADIAGALGLAAPEAPAASGTAFIWAVRGMPAPTVVIAAENAAALEALLRPLPRYGGESWLLFDDSRVIERGLWPADETGGLFASRRRSAAP